MTINYEMTQNAQVQVGKIVAMGFDAAMAASDAFQKAANQYGWSAKREGTFTGGPLYDRTMFLAYQAKRLNVMAKAINAKAKKEGRALAGL